MSEDEKKPRNYIDHKDPSTWKKPDDVAWGDWMMNPARPLTPRARRLCQLVASGMKQGEAAEKIGYTQSWASMILTSTKGKKYLDYCQEKLFEETVTDRIKDLGTQALDVIEETLDATDPNIKPELRVSTAKWVAEKISGKAKQEVEYTGNIVHEFYDKLDKLEKSGQILDVTPEKTAAIEASEEKETTERDKLDYFLNFEADDLEK